MKNETAKGEKHYHEGTKDTKGERINAKDAKSYPRMDADENDTANERELEKQERKWREEYPSWDVVIVVR